MPGRPIVALVLVGLWLSACGLVVDTTPPPDRSGLERAGWVLREVAGRRLTLMVPMGGSDCYRLDGVDVIETADSVEIRAWVENLDQGRGCFAVLTMEAIAVDLRAPVGQRRLEGCLLERSHPQFKDRASCAEAVPEAFGLR